MIAAPIVVALGLEIGGQSDLPDGLQPIDLVVFVVAAQALDTMEFRPLKLAVLQTELPRLSLPTLSRSLKRLVQGGFIVRSARPVDRREYSYRVPLSPRKVVAVP